MITLPAQHVLRDGRIATLRHTTPTDALAMSELERAIVRARHGVVKREADLSDEPMVAIEQHQRLIQGGEKSGYFLVAEVPGIAGIAGEARVRRYPFAMIKHVGVIALGIHPEAQHVGLGRLLMEQLILMVRAFRDDDGTGYRRLELYVRGDNDRAQALYRSLGFIQEGLRKAYVLGDDGTYIDDLMMGMPID